MPCPFLEEAHVRSCRAAPMRKLITEAGTNPRDEMCALPEYHRCAVYRERTHGSDFDQTERCPHFEESLVQYCGAAPVRKYVPYQDEGLSSCAGDGYRFCELYLSLKHPAPSDVSVPEITVPDHLHFSANHMWVDVGENGACHVGIDAFLARVLGTVDRIGFATSPGIGCPSAAITKGAVTWIIAFPNPIFLDRANLYLRSNTSRLTLDCYGAGWLFSGRTTPTTTNGLIGGNEAGRWMDREIERLSERIHRLSGSPNESMERVMNDGGMFTAGCIQFLRQDDGIRLLHDFFGPHLKWD